MPKMVHFGEFLKNWNLRSNSVTGQVSLNRTKIGGKCHNVKNSNASNFETMCFDNIKIEWKLDQIRHFKWIFNHCDRCLKMAYLRRQEDQFESPKLWVFLVFEILHPQRRRPRRGENWWRNYHGLGFFPKLLKHPAAVSRQFSHSSSDSSCGLRSCWAAAIIYRSRRHNWLENFWIYILSTPVTLPSTPQIFKPEK